MTSRLTKEKNTMPRFSDRSMRRLLTCDQQLVILFEEVIKYFDCTVVCGHRDKEDQMAAYNSKNSKTPWPRSKHNSLPSKAVDVIPYPLDWEDRERMTYFAGVVKGIASQLGIGIRWGGDWDRDTEVKDNKFDDLVHFELYG